MPALTLRLTDELLSLLRVAAARRGVSLNTYVVEAARAQVLREGLSDDVVRAALDRVGA